MPDRILVVDDSNEIRSVLGAQLRKQGYKVDTARDGAEGSEKAAEFKPDLIIMDIMMPRMDGFQACRAIRANAGTKHIPIILLSALGGEDDILQGIEAGANDYLVKPFRAPELSAKIKVLIRRAGSQASRADADTVEVPRSSDLDTIRRFKETGQIVSKDFAGFQIIDKLGQGGSGAVYRAIEPVNLTPVALKVVSPFISQSPGFVRRFARSSDISIKVRHPNIVRGYTIGEHQGIHYLTQELVEGPTLDKVLERQGPLAPLRVTILMRQIVEALVYLESQGFIHRDLKPGNIFEVKGPDGGPFAKLADFGLSRAIDDIGGTIEGHVLGTPQYISPEQAMGATKLDMRCDLYSLAATAFHLVTGHPPFGGDTFQSLILAHVHAPVPSVRTVSPEVPECLDNLLRTFMAKKPEERAPNMQVALEMVTTVENELRELAAASNGKRQGTGAVAPVASSGTAQ